MLKSANSATDDEFDCLTCGACCFSEETGYIAIFGHDERRMSDEALKLAKVADGQLQMRFDKGRCNALQADGRILRCAIYPMRPDACRWLEPGSAACREMIREKLPRARAHLQQCGKRPGEDPA